jgi:acylphosphatase
VSRDDDPPPTRPDAQGARGDDVRVRISVRGRVQGVWFRGAARETAQLIGVVGWARNLADGSVEILAQGSPDAIERFRAWCEHGPTGARVDAVSTQREIVQGDLREFRVRS